MNEFSGTMKIIVTGATGAFGASITRYLANASHEIIATGRSTEPPAELLKYASYIQADITQPFDLPDADVCIHAAALSDDKASAKELYLPNVIGTKNVVTAARKCPKFIFISSSSVYLPDPNPITEEMAGKQNNKLLSPYGKSKLLSEEILKETFHGESCFILRPRAFYGPGDTQIMPRMMKLVKNQIFNKPGSLEINLSMTHYENIGRAIELCLDSNIQGMRTYNVADSEVYRMIDTLRQLFEAIYGHKLEEKQINIKVLKLLAAFRIAGFTPLLVRALTQNMVLDISKIENDLGYHSKINFKDSLPAIKNWVDKIGGPDVLKTGDKSLVWNT